MNSGQECAGIPGMVSGEPAPAIDVQKRILYPMTQLIQMLVVITKLFAVFTWVPCVVPLPEL